MSIRKQMILYFSCVMVVIFTLTELINGWQAYRQLETLEAARERVAVPVKAAHHASSLRVTASR